MLYRPCVCTNGICFTSGQLPKLENQEGFPQEFVSQARQALENLLSVITNNGGSIESIVKVNIYLSDINNFKDFNEVYEKFFDNALKPARTCLEVGNLPSGALIEVEAVFSKIE